MYLQSHVVPVCSYVRQSTMRSTIKALHGSAFFIDERGTFLTARHVVEGAIERAEADSSAWGLCQKYDQGKSPLNVMCKVLRFEFAPAPFDIAVGQSSYPSTTILTLSRHADAHEWSDVVTMGYPLTIVEWDSTRWDKLPLRCHKGYIQRVIPTGEMKLGDAAPGFELSFQISKGTSGAPVFISRHPKDVVVGVCVGSVRRELVEYEHVEVIAPGKELQERRLKIDEYGLAHDLRPLLDWKPAMFNGRSLLDVATA